MSTWSAALQNELRGRCTICLDVQDTFDCRAVFDSRRFNSINAFFSLYFIFSTTQSPFQPFYLFFWFFMSSGNRRGICSSSAPHSSDHSIRDMEKSEGMEVVVAVCFRRRKITFRGAAQAHAHALVAFLQEQMKVSVGQLYRPTVQITGKTDFAGAARSQLTGNSTPLPNSLRNFEEPAPLCSLQTAVLLLIQARCQILFFNSRSYCTAVHCE